MESLDGSVVLHPLESLCHVNGEPVTKPTRLKQGGEVWFQTRIVSLYNLCKSNVYLLTDLPPKAMLPQVFVMNKMSVVHVCVYLLVGLLICSFICCFNRRRFASRENQHATLQPPPRGCQVEKEALCKLSRVKNSQPL